MITTKFNIYNSDRQKFISYNSVLTGYPQKFHFSWELMNFLFGLSCTMEAYRNNRSQHSHRKITRTKLPRFCMIKQCHYSCRARKYLLHVTLTWVYSLLPLNFWSQIMVIFFHVGVMHWKPVILFVVVSFGNYTYSNLIGKVRST